MGTKQKALQQEEKTVHLKTQSSKAFGERGGPKTRLQTGTSDFLPGNVAIVEPGIKSSHK